jgi:hypothetical protein
MIWVFLMYLFLALQVMALVGGVVTRRWPLRPQRLVWRGTSVEHASSQIRALLYDIDDVRFAYPTGQFVPSEEETDLAAGRVVMDEANFTGSKGFGMVIHLFVMAGAVTRGVIDDSPLLGLLVGLFAFWFAAILAAPFLIASLIDVVYRRLYRSRITADVRPHESMPNAVTVDLEFRGLSSFGIVGDVLRAVATPAAPAGSRAALQPTGDPSGATSAARAAVWASAAGRRSTVMYGSGVLASVVIAAVLLAISPHPFEQQYDYASSADSTSSYYDEPSEDAAVDEPVDQSEEDTAPTDESDSDTTTTTDQTDEETRYVSAQGNYSVLPPSGWLQDSSEKDKGPFYESRWHLPGEGDVYGLVDYTPGFGGTPLEGAATLRAARRSQSDYEELDFSAQGEARRWEFIAQGTHKVDVFYRCGGVGVAILASAPADVWDDHESELTEFVDSLTCGEASDPSADETETTPEDTTTNTTTTPSGDGSDTPKSGGGDGQVYARDTNAGGMEHAIRAHWQARLDGDYSTAYGYYTGAVRSRVGLESSWAEQVRRDGLSDVEFNDFDVELANDQRGRMRAEIRTEAESTGCRDWVFTYTIVRQSSRWLIYDSRAHDSAC